MLRGTVDYVDPYDPQGRISTDGGEVVSFRPRQNVVGGAVVRVYRDDVVFCRLEGNDMRVDFVPEWARRCRFVHSWSLWGNSVKGAAEAYQQSIAATGEVKQQLRGLEYRPSYVGELGEFERDNFHSASVVLWRRHEGRVQYLMAFERRKGSLRLNFFGGKRASLEETPAETMRREVFEETAEKVDIDAVDEGVVLWCKASKQVVFLHELDFDAASQVQELRRPPEVPQDVFEQHGAAPEGVVTAVWVGLDHLLSNVRGRNSDLQAWQVEWVRLLHEHGQLPSGV